MSDIMTFLVNHSQTMANLATVAGVPLGIGALVFTGYQILLNNRQVKAKSIYEIQKDSREMAVQLLTDNNVSHLLLERDLEAEDLVSAAVGRLFNFYSAIFQQYRHKILDEDLWALFEVEIAEFLNNPYAADFWRSKENSGQYDANFVKFIRRLQTSTGSDHLD